MIKNTVVKRKVAELNPFCHMAGPNDCIEITEWTNGEGFDIFIDRKNSQERFAITYGELEAVYLVAKMPS
jgi:hypothetical protein